MEYRKRDKPPTILDAHDWRGLCMLEEPFNSRETYGRGARGEAYSQRGLSERRLSSQGGFLFLVTLILIGGVSRAREEHHGGLLHLLFSARTMVLFEQVSHMDSFS